jgi:hypothetical protein
MVTISFIQSRWDEVMKMLLKVVLPCISITQTFPRKVIYAPLSRNSLRMDHPYNNQNLQQLQMVLQHGNHHSPTYRPTHPLKL